MIDVRLGVEGDHGWQIAQEVRRDPGFEDLPVLLCSADSSAMEDLESGLGPDASSGNARRGRRIDLLTETIDELLADPAVN